MKASAFNVELEMLRQSKDPNAKYKLQDILERADDSLTRRKMKEQYATTNAGQTIDTMLTGTEGFGERDQKHARSLISEGRDAATDKLAKMDPKDRAQLEDNAAAWADQLLKVTRSDDRDDSKHADKVASILGPRSPEQLEVIRSRVRLQTSGTTRTTAYEELDRSFTGRDKDIALAGLSGNHVHVASTQLVDAAAEGDPERVNRIVAQLGDEKLAVLRDTNPLLLSAVANHMPTEQRGQIQAAFGKGREAEAEGARIATLFQPVDISVADMQDRAKTQRLLNQKEAQDPERMIEELGKKTPEELSAAREAWDTGGHGKSWDELIGERYKDADSTVRLRIEAAARGDKLGERALRLRQGMRTFDQSLIDQALSSPDLQSTDPKKKSAAEAERHALEAKMREYDAGDQRLRAMFGGKGAPGSVVGRSMDEQLASHYEQAKNHDTESSGGFTERIRHEGTKSERMERTREKATADRYAATEMWNEGDAHASTKVRRAELSGDSAKKAEVLEKLDGKNSEGSRNTLDAQSAEYRMKFGNRNMLAAEDPEAASKAAEMVARMTGDERPTEEIAAELSRKNMNVGELRVQHVRESGAIADRTREQRVTQQKELRDLSHSGALESAEYMRYLKGGNRGSDDLLDSSIHLMERGQTEGVDDREASRRDRSTTSALELQREEKQREADKVAQALSIAAKVAALMTANPALFVAIDAGFSVMRIAAKELIANEANDATSDIKHGLVDFVYNIATAKLGGLGNGLEVGSQGAKTAQMMQRAGNVGAAVGSSATHAMIDGDEIGGSSVVRAALGAVVPGYVRGRAETAITGTSKFANTTRGVVGTATDLGFNAGISGGHLDSASLIDAFGNTAQNHMHRGAHGGQRKPHTGDSDATGGTRPMHAADLDTHVSTTRSSITDDANMLAVGHFADTDHAVRPTPATEPPVHERVTQPMQAAEPVREPASLRERIDQSTGVDKGPEYEQFRNDMKSFYENQEKEAANVINVKGRHFDPGVDPTDNVGWESSYSAREFKYDNATLTQVGVDINLNPMEGASEGLLKQVEKNTFDGVDRAYNFGPEGRLHTLPNGNRLHVEPNFVGDATQADFAVKVLPERGHPKTADPRFTNMTQWVANDVLDPRLGPTTTAHEVGHMLGLRDEYRDRRYISRATDTSPMVNDDGSLMGNYVPPGTAAELKPRHLEQIGNSIDSARGAERNAAASIPETPAPTESKLPEGPKTRGTPEAQLTTAGRANPVPLTPKELAQTSLAQSARNKYLKSAREDAVPAGLDPESARLIGRSDNAIRDHMTPDDIAARLKETRGVVIQSPDGRAYDHIREVSDAHASVARNIEAIKAQVQRLVARGDQQHQVDALQTQLSKLSKLLESMPRP